MHWNNMITICVFKGLRSADGSFVFSLFWRSWLQWTYNIKVALNINNQEILMHWKIFFKLIYCYFILYLVSDIWYLVSDSRIVFYIHPMLYWGQLWSARILRANSKLTVIYFIEITNYVLFGNFQHFISHETKSQVSFTDPTSFVVVRSSCVVRRVALTFHLKNYSSSSDFDQTGYVSSLWPMLLGGKLGKFQNTTPPSNIKLQ